METTKLKIKHYKGYKEIADTLQDGIKSGKSKMYQLKEWRRYFEWTEHGRYDWEITIIHDQVREKEDGRKNNGSESQYGELIDNLMLMSLTRYHFSERKNFFYQLFKMFWVESYYETQNNVREIAEEKGVPLWIIDDYFLRVGSFMNNLLKGCIERLISNGSIEFMKVMMCKDTVQENKEVREMAISEIEQYETIKENTAKQLELYSKVVPPSISAAYWAKVNEETKKVMDLQSIWSVYNITQGYHWMDNVPIYRAHHPEEWDVRYAAYKTELNKVICDRIIRNARRRVDNAIGLKDTYGEDQFGWFEQDNKREKYFKNKSKYDLLIKHSDAYIRVYEELTDELIKTYDAKDEDYYVE